MQVILAFNRRTGRKTERTVLRLAPHVPLRERLDGFAEDRSVDAGLQGGGDGVSIFEPDNRAAVQAERLLGEIAAAAAPQIAREPVRNLEIAPMPLEPHPRLAVLDR